MVRQVIVVTVRILLICQSKYFSRDSAACISGSNCTSEQSDKLASINRSWQSKEGTYRALGMARIEPTPSKSEDWTLLSP